MGAITYLDRVNISISGHWLAEEYHFTNPQLGLIFGAFPLEYALFQVPAGWLADRFGSRRVLAAVFIALGSGASGAGTATVVLAGGVGALYLAQSSFWTVTADIAGSSAGTVSGLVNMGAQTGSILTAVLTPRIASHFGWTASFLTASTLCALGAVTWFLVDPERVLVPEKL